MIWDREPSPCPMACARPETNLLGIAESSCNSGDMTGLSPAAGEDIGKQLVSLTHIGLVNIIPGKEIVREFLQADARPPLIAEEALRLLNDEKYYESMQHELSLIRQQLGDGNGSKNVAELAWKMLNNKL